MRGIVVAHGEERVEPHLFGRGVEVLADGEDAMVETVRFPDDPELVGVDRAVLDPAFPVQVEHRARGGVALRQTGQRVALAADVIAVLADEDVEAADRHIHSGAQSLAAQAPERNERGLRRVDRAGGDRAALEVGERLHRTAATRHEIGEAIAVGVAHGDRAAAVAGSPLRVDPRERRVPRDVDRAGQQPVVLVLVGGVERDVDRRALRVEEVADDFPDHRDLGVVHHRPDLQWARHQNTSRPHRARPMNS